MKQKNRLFRMDDETYAKLTDISRRFSLSRSTVLRLYVTEKHALYRSHKMLPKKVA